MIKLFSNVKNVGNKSILITGGSNGLGLELAKIYLQMKFKVIILDIVPPKLTLEEFKYIHCNLSSTIEIERALEQAGTVDIVVNNAAVIVKKPLGEMSTDEISRIISVNIQAPTIITALSLRKNKETIKIINISSSAALIPTPNASIYGASKAYLTRLSMNIMFEKNNAKIFNFEVSGMNTDFQIKSGINGANSGLLLDPKKVAAIVYKKSRRNTSRNYRIGLTGKIFYLSRKISPIAIHENILGFLFRKMR